MESRSSNVCKDSEGSCLSTHEFVAMALETQPWRDDGTSSLYRHNTKQVSRSVKIAGHHLSHFFTATDGNEAVHTKCRGNMT